MSVLIKGFEKPDHCLRCPMKGIDDECVLQGVEVCDEYEEWEQQMANCPLIPVPKHGDLIERKAICLTDFEIAMCDGNYKEGMKMLLEKTESAPTIIPAEEKET